MEYRHTPVLLAEVTQQLTLHDGSIFVDCTLGGAGHTERITQLVAPTGIVVGIDQDDAALTAAADTLRLGQQELTKIVLASQRPVAAQQTLALDNNEQKGTADGLKN